MAGSERHPLEGVVGSDVLTRAFRQVYRERDEQPPIESAHIIELEKFFLTEDGWFSELCRLDSNSRPVDALGLALPPYFRVRQINESLTKKGQVKAWHFHRSQDEIWFLEPHARAIVGLMDLRKDSPTVGNIQRYVFKGEAAVFAIVIPRLVAHGICALDDTKLKYFTTAYYDPQDEWRLPFNFGVPLNFWSISNG